MCNAVKPPYCRLFGLLLGFFFGGGGLGGAGAGRELDSVPYKCKALLK